MRKLLIAILIAVSLAVAPAALAQSSFGANTQLAQPNLQVPVPGLTLTKALMAGGNLSAPYLAQYVAGIYKFLLSIVGVVAAISMIYGGFLWMTSGGTADRAKAGQKRITDSIAGLVLAFGSYLILYLINPATVNFSDFKIIMATTEIAEVPSGDEEAADALGGTPVAICKDHATCKAICDTCKNNPSSCPTTTPGILDSGSVKPIENVTGLIGGGNKSTLATIELLKKAAAIAVAENPAYVLKITSGYRDLAGQIRVACDAYKANEGSKVGHSIAWPGGSLHGVGFAVDVQLWNMNPGIEKCSDPKVGCLSMAGNTAAQNQVRDGVPIWKDGAQKLHNIMTKAGFRRLGNEIWHFEPLNAPALSCRCTTDCKFPPAVGC